MPVFNIAGAAVAGFFILFILSKKKRKKADYLLILINLLMIGFLTLVVLVDRAITVNLFFLQAQMPFYLFPVFLLFALETLQQKVKGHWLLLFIPAFITTICIAADLYFIHDYNTDALLNQVYNDPPFFYHVLYKGNQLFFIAALIWLIGKIESYKREIKERFSFIDPIELRWLAHVSWIYLALTLISLTTFLIANFNVLPIDAQTSFSIVSACLVLAIFYLSFHGIRQASISEYYGQQRLEPIEETAPPANADGIVSKEKYKTTAISQAERESIHRQLLNLFEHKAVYRESKLQLQDVADALRVSAHSLSQTINTIQGEPFYDFVNRYRVKHLQKLLQDPGQKRFTILALGLESGFNSKASLNRVFKERTGHSPSGYQKLHLPN